MEEISKRYFKKKFSESKVIARIYRVPYNQSQHQGVVEELNRTVQNLLISAKDHQRTYII